MNDTYREPIYNLKSVVRETGVKPDTLRAWERRYGLPQPARTEGGHRLYSQRDIDTIKWQLARQREGLRINQAVELWRSLEGADQDPLQSRPMSEVSFSLETMGQTMADLRQRWVSACLFESCHEFRQNKCIVKDDCIGNQPGTFAPDLLFLFSSYPEFSEISVKYRPPQFMVSLSSVKCSGQEL